MSDNEHSERQRALAEKKQKLAEMRAAKQRQKEERISGIGGGLRIDNVSTRTTMTPQELDAMMADLGIQQRNHREEAPSDPSSTNSTARECNGTLHLDSQQLLRKSIRPQNLELIPVQTVNIQPKNEFISYCKTTQTDEERERHSHGEFSMGSQDFDFEDELSLDEALVGQIGSFDESPTMEVRKHLKNLHFHHYSHQTQKEAPDDHAHQTAAKLPPLSDEEKRKILSSADFGRFFQQASRVIERSLAEDYDIFIDYITGSRNGAVEDKFDKRELLTLNRKIFDEKLTANRGVRAIDFSAFYPELVAVSYDRNKDAPLQPDSVINVWNTQFKTSSPEMTFHSSSRVMSMVFDPFQSNIIIGGCYSGQICIWDTRVNKRMPVCKTSFSNGHSQPVLCMKMVGSTNAHDLITISTDGRLCSWSTDNLQQPIEALNLVCNKTKRQISALSMAFLHDSINNFVVGSEENELYIGDRHASKGDMNRNIIAHQMAVTSVDTHQATGTSSVDFSSLCLTGSMDFGIKLWNLKADPKKDAASIELKTDPILCLERKHTFYITDVQWSPAHPAVFASLSADGMLNLWNFNVNTENPITSFSIGGSGTKFRWSRNGQQLVVGDESGALHLFDVHECLYNVRSDEWDKLNSTLADLATVAAAPIFDH